MTPEQWHRIEAVFERVADVPHGDQEAALAAACEGDAELADEVRRLLAADRAGGAPIADVVDGAACLPPAEPVSLVGRRLGPYRVVGELGRGGMGIVLDAVRDDEAFDKRVAIKVATRAVYSSEFLRRFQHERRIQARLEHPNIARLIDAGTTDDGIPYFVMEYVEGEPIHVWAAGNLLPIAGRIALFLQVCDAVDYAHQNLVVHCDLKPGNILVAAGTVRLLDFGIARLIGTGDGTHTLAGLVAVTPDYCSPEQVRGEPVTTRTDVYALGLVLHELLTDTRGQVADTSSPGALERSVCETVVTLPSAAVRAANPALARRLEGDLDMIVATATRKQPERRYASVSALAADLRRHLDGRPIDARRDSAWYRASRFVRRHWLPLAAGALLIVSLGGGVAAARYQAKRAERRFDQVRGIANALMVDVHDAIRDLPGSTAAQEVVVRTAVRYLDALAQEAAGDRALQVEIADGYMRVARLAFASSRPSLGRPDQARASYAKASAILAGLGPDAGDDVAAASATARLHTQLAEFQSDTGDADAALESVTAAVDASEAALARHPDELSLLEALREACGLLVSRFPTYPSAARMLDRYVQVAERVTALRPETAKTLTDLGVAYSQAANYAASAGEVDRADALYRRNIGLQERALALEPDNATIRRNLVIAWSNIGDLALGPLGTGSYSGAGGPPIDIGDQARRRAREAFDRAVEQAEWLFNHDPSNDTARFDLAVCLGRAAPAWPTGDPQAIDQLERSLALLADVETRHHARAQPFVIEFRGSLAERQRQAGRLDRALATWSTVDAHVRALVDADPDDYYAMRLAIPIAENWAEALVADGQVTAARRVADRVRELGDAVGSLAALYTRAPGWPPRVRDWLARFHARLGETALAEAARRESVEMWADVASRRDVPPDLVDEARKNAAAAGK